MKTYSIFGAGAAGLYTAWRFLNGEAQDGKPSDRLIKEGDVINLYDWGKYNFTAEDPGSREPGARVCTWFHNDDKDSSYLELGGMRYSHWNGCNTPLAAGHRVVTQTIKELGLDAVSVPFNEGSDPLLSLRAKNMYTSEINSNNPAPYNADHYGDSVGPDDGFTKLENLGILPDQPEMSRRQWCDFYNTGKIEVDMAETSIFQKGDLLKNIGYWNLGYDVLGQEGFQYMADGNGYSSNVVNSNTAQSYSVNAEFTPGTEYKTLTTGFSSLFDGLFKAIKELATQKGVDFRYHPDVRLGSILKEGDRVRYRTATREFPDKLREREYADAAFLAMPRGAIEKVAQATRYYEGEGTHDVLNEDEVQLYLESVMMEPSYKIGMFFDSPWWTEKATYPPKLTSYFLTIKGVDKLATSGFSPEYIVILTKSYEEALRNQCNTPDQQKPSPVIDEAFSSKEDFIEAVQTLFNARLTYEEENLITSVAELDNIGPSATDMPIRQVVYFGNNAKDKSKKPVYGILGSYDDILYTTFWKALELGPDGTRHKAESNNLQPLEGPKVAKEVMVKMLRKQLASLHFGPQSNYTDVPMPLETKYMDWSLPPFNAGYHAYKSHYDIADVQQKVRKPSQMIEGVDAEIYIVGETYSNDQAWVEGAFCTAESVLNDFFNMKPIIDPETYPFICPKDN